MKRRTAPILAALGIAATAACKGGESGGEDVDLLIPHREGEVPVTVTAPPGWAKSPHDPYGFLPAKHTGEPGVASWSLRADCFGSCDAEAIPDNVERAIRGEKRVARRVTGFAADESPAELEVLLEKDLETGKQLAYRVTYSDEAPEGMRDHIAVFCPRHRDGDDFFVVLEATAPAAQEDEYLEDFLAACESVRIGR